MANLIYNKLTKQWVGSKNRALKTNSSLKKVLEKWAIFGIMLAVVFMLYVRSDGI